MPSSVEIPNRVLFTAAEVCEMAHLQPYVLRSWEGEFPALGVTREAGKPRIYRQHDVAQVLRIKDLLFVEGLTLAGVRRRIEEEAAPVAESPTLEKLLGRHARERLTAIRQGLRSILDLLATNGHAAGPGKFRLAPRSAVARRRAKPAARTQRRRPGFTARKGARKPKRAHR